MSFRRQEEELSRNIGSCMPPTTAPNESSGRGKVLRPAAADAAAAAAAAAAPAAAATVADKAAVASPPARIRATLLMRRAAHGEIFKTARKNGRGG